MSYRVAQKVQTKDIKGYIIKVKKLMQIFLSLPDKKGDDFILDENESKHSVRVLRMSKGDPVRLIDGTGNL